MENPYNRDYKSAMTEKIKRCLMLENNIPLENSDNPLESDAGGYWILSDTDSMIL